MPHLSVAFALKDDPLHPLFPQSMVCQPWKLQWLGGNLQSSSERAMDNFKKLGESGSIHVDTRGLLNAFKDVVNLRLHLGETKGVIPPQHGSNVDKVIVATNKFMQRLEASPYISELPFRVKAKIFEPMVDMRIAALNLKRALKPCLADPKPSAPVGVPALPIPSNIQLLGRGFL